MIFNRITSVLLDINESLPCLAFDALLCTFKNCCVRKNKTKQKNLTTTYFLSGLLLPPPLMDTVWLFW